MVATSEGSGAWGAVMAIGIGILKKKRICHAYILDMMEGLLKMDRDGGTVESGALRVPSLRLIHHQWRMW